MFKLLLLLMYILFTVEIMAEEKHIDSNKSKTLLHSIEVHLEENTIMVGRKINPKCKKIPIANYSFWSGNYAGEHILKECKATFVKTAGALSPIRVAKGVETFGELEVLNFIDELQADDDMLLIDIRKPLWFETRTIPGAINIPFEYIYRADEHPKEFKKALKRLGVKEGKNSHDFKEAKIIAIFCNASWCTQSTHMIQSLLALGYPANKIKWYRGGLESWLGLNMSFVKGVLEKS